MTAQVSDVGITDKVIRRTATAHGIISFVYNTALVALMVNIAASAICRVSLARLAGDGAPKLSGTSKRGRFVARLTRLDRT